MEGKRQEEETLPIDENCYGEEHLTLPIERTIGTRNEERGNFRMLSSSSFIAYSGIGFAIYDLNENKQLVGRSRDGGGIGAVAVDCSKKHFAVAEKGVKPNIYIYRTSDLEVVSVLSGGTERGYCSVSFSPMSDRFVSVGGAPDYTIVVWDWRTGKHILRSKAFSQEVYKVAFSDFNDASICSVGMAHIKFWKISNTFTGLKLPGEIGKFGATELSDIHDFVHLSDGSVVSGSESGELLVWDAKNIKNVVRISEATPCHSGNVNCVKLHKERLLITASATDNVIRVWAVQDFKNLGSEGSLQVHFSPIKEIQLDNESGVVNIDHSLLHTGCLYVQERRGSLLKVQISMPEDEIECRHVIQFEPIITELFSFPSDSVTGMAYAKGQLYLTGNDGRLKSVDVETTDSVYWSLDRHQITCMALKGDETSIVVGNSKGLVKSYSVGEMKLISVHKVFEEAVASLCLHSSAVVAVSKRSVFVLSWTSGGELKPQFMVETGEGLVTQSIVWNGCFVFGTSVGEVKAFKLPVSESFDNEKNFLLKGLTEEFETKLQMMEFQKPKKDEDDIRYYLNDEMEFHDVEWEPQSIRSLAVLTEETSDGKVGSNSRVIVGSEADFVGYLYVLELRPKEVRKEAQLMVVPGESFVGTERPEQEVKAAVVRPLKAIKTRPKVVSFIGFEWKRDVCYWGYVDGLISMRSSNDLDKELARVRAFSHDLGEVLRVSSFGTPNIFAYSRDSTLAILRVNVVKWPATDKSKFSRLQAFRLARCDKVKDVRQSIEDRIVDGYSLQKDKIQSFKDRMARSAKLQRDEIVARVGLLRKVYSEIKEENRRLAVELRLSEHEIDFDPSLSKALPEVFECEIEEVEKETEYDVKVAKMRVEKLSKFFVRENSEFVFSVSKLSSSESVNSFRLKLMTNYMTTGLEQITMLIESDKGTELEEKAEAEEGSGSSNTKSLLGMLADLKKRIGENKTKDPYVQFKHRIKEECAEFDTIDKLRDHQKSIGMEIEALKKSEGVGRNSEESKEAQQARGHFGDYVLKSSPNFKIDEKTRIDLQKLETHILLLEKFIFSTKESFNRNLAALRTRKQELMRSIESVNRQVATINTQLGTREDGLRAQFEAEREQPETRYKVTETEISELLKEQRVSEVRAKEAKREPKNDLSDEIDSLRTRTLKRFPDILVKTDKAQATGDKDSKSEVPADNSNQKKYFSALSLKQQQSVSTGAQTAKNELLKVTVETRVKKLTNTDNQKFSQLLKLGRQKAMAEKSRVLSQLKAEMSAFDREIDKISVERGKVEFELKMAEMRVLELFREWLEIQVFEEEDQVLRRELGDKKSQIKEWNERKVANVFTERDVLVKITKLDSELKSLEESYKEKIFPSEPEKAEFVYRYFSVNYRRNQNGEGADEGEDSGAKEYDPNSLDPDKKECILYFEQNEEWVDLLKKRYETDEALRAFQKTKAGIDAENLKIEERIRAIQKSLLETKSELDELQLKKLKRVHRLNCSFILDLDQVFLETPIASLDEAVVFTTEQLKNLRRRTVELEEECRRIEAERGELAVSQDALVKSLNVLRACRRQAKEELDENFKLKFGEYVNLDILNSLKETKRLKELKKEYREADKASGKRVEDARISLGNTQDELVELKRKNTEILKRITLLGSAQVKLNRTLDNTNRQIFKDEKDLATEGAKNNKRDLLKVIKLLNSELDALKAEIEVLRQK